MLLSSPSCAILSRLWISLVLTHALTVFYSSSFQLLDFSKLFDRSSLATYYARNVIVAKAIASFSCIFCSMQGKITTLDGSILTVLLAIPQLYRSKSVLGQRLRVILGPVTPVLAVNNVLMVDWKKQQQQQIPLTVASAIVSFLAFGVIRPDNTAVLECLGIAHHVVIDTKFRRRFHGILAASNTFLALVLILHHIQ
jgi:hypothetical protein